MIRLPATSSMILRTAAVAARRPTATVTADSMLRRNHPQVCRNAAAVPGRITTTRTRTTAATTTAATRRTIEANRLWNPTTTSSSRFFGNAVNDDYYYNQTQEVTDGDGPYGELFNHFDKEIGPSLIGQTASIRRTFGPSCNSTVLLTTGGEALAAHASFDPRYDRAVTWIRQRAVGHAKLSPILLAGLTGALLEAAFPQAVLLEQSMKQHLPLIVGVAVEAVLTVTDVNDSSGRQYPNSNNNSNSSTMAENSLLQGQLGYQVQLNSVVKRIQDDAVISEGTFRIWIPDYKRM